MCLYVDMKFVYRGCLEDPKHVIVERTYKLCEHPRPDSIYRHCSDATAEPSSNIIFGSTKRAGPCSACTDNKEMTIVSSAVVKSMILGEQ